MGTTKQSQAQLRPVDLEKYEYVQGVKPNQWISPNSRYMGTTGARSFDGEQYVELNSALEPTSDFALSLYVYLDALPGAGEEVALFGDISDTSKNGLLVDENGKLVLRLAGSYGTILNNTALVATTWYHIVVQREAATGNIEVYLNGELDCTDHAEYSGDYPETGRYSLLSQGWTISDGGAA